MNELMNVSRQKYKKTVVGNQKGEPVKAAYDE